MAVPKISDRYHLTFLIIYYLIWLLLIVSSFYPKKILWAFSIYAYIDELSRYLILSIAGIVPIVVMFFNNYIDKEIEIEKSDSLKFIVSALIILLGSVALFIIFRAKAFYLGDGYTLLSTLASDNPILKQREIGESTMHLWVRDIFGSGETAALLSFQTISITAGSILLLLLIPASMKLFSSFFNRLIFIIITITGGYSLLWFGYVENYSLFVMSVGIYSLVGYLAVTNKISHYWIIVPLIMAIIMHVMGVTLILSTFFILLSRPGPRKILSRFSSRTLLTVSLLILAIILIPFIYVYNKSYFFKLALVPLFENRFTVDGYTLFSLAHIADVINLIILLVPILIIAIVYFIRYKNRFLPLSIKAWYLIMLTLSVFLALFLFDPRIGISRDWDLFSFTGFPLMLLSSLTLLSLLKKKIITRSVIILAVSLNLMFLVPRVMTQISVEHALEQFRQYISWDPLKNRTAMTIIAEHYNNKGDSTQALIEIEKWREDYPEWQQNQVAMKMFNEGYVNEAINIYRDIIRINPIYPAAYGNLGLAYMKQMNLDSAKIYLEIAEGMNPYNHRVLANLGMYHYYYENYSKAEEYFERALERDSLISTAIIGLLNLYKKINERDKYYEYLSRVVWYKEAPVECSREMGKYYLNLGNYKDAALVFEDAIKYKGLDSLYVDSLKEKYPQLKIE
ncbi:MAG: hypothetical protein ABIJ12_11345 [bacterium]